MQTNPFTVDNEDSVNPFADPSIHEALTSSHHDMYATTTSTSIPKTNTYHHGKNDLKINTSTSSLFPHHDNNSHNNNNNYGYSSHSNNDNYPSTTIPLTGSNGYGYGFESGNGIDLSGMKESSSSTTLNGGGNGYMMGNGSSSSTSFHTNAKEEELRKREEDLLAREKQLRQQQEALAKVGYHPPNWPPFKPLIYHDIDVEIPESEQKTVRGLYHLWLGLEGTLIFNVLSTFFILIAPNGLSSGPTEFGVSFVYIFTISACSFFLWYRPVYNAYMKESSLYYCKSKLFLLLSFIFILLLDLFFVFVF